MKTASVVLSLAFVGVSAFAANDMQLLKKVKESGIKAIPQSQLELLKLVDDPNNPITEKK